MIWSLIATGPILLLTLGLSSPASAAECLPPEPFKATYYSEVDRFITLKGEGVQSLVKRDDGLYQFRFDVDSMVADVRESVVFEWDAKGCQLIPLEYAQSLEGKLIRDRRTEFTNHRDENEVRGSYEGESFTTDSKDLYVDPLGLQIQVRQDLKAGKTEMKYHMIHKGKILVDRYRVVANESLKLNGKVYDTVKLEKVRPDTSDRETYMWMATDLDYALVKLIHQEPGKEKYEVVMKRFTQ